jgi:hypothetical protein
MLAPIVAESRTWVEVAKKVGIVPMTGAQTHLRNVCVKYGLDHSHFVGQRWNKGRTFPKKPLSFYLCKGSTIKSDFLRRRLVAEGIKRHECEECKLTEWMGEPIDLELDHINSDHFDNCLVNLQLLCPNCHARKTRMSRKERRAA